MNEKNENPMKSKPINDNLWVKQRTSSVYNAKNIT